MVPLHPMWTLLTGVAAPGLVGEPEGLPVDGGAEGCPDAEAELGHPVPVLAVARRRQHGRHGEHRRVEVAVPRRLVACGMPCSR